MQIITRFTPTKDDHINSSTAFLIKTNFGIIVGLILLTFFLGTNAINAPQLSTRADWSTPFFLLCPTPLLAILIIFVFPIINNFRIKNFVAKNKQLLEPVSWVFNEDKVIFKVMGSETTYDWRAFHGGFEIKNYFLISHPTNKQNYFFIPKIAFETKEEQRKFIELFEKRTKKKLVHRTFAVSYLMPFIRYFGFITVILLSAFYTYILIQVIF